MAQMCALDANAHACAGGHGINARGGIGPSG